MIKKAGTITQSVLVSAAFLNLMPLAAMAQAASTSKSVDAGTTWAVSTTTRLDSLTIGNNAKVTAPKGYDLTLTVNGVSTPIVAGTYKGKVVLTPTKEFLVTYSGYAPYHYETAVLINDGKYVKDQSVAAAAGSNAMIDDLVATNVSVVSKEEKFNGIVVTGNSSYTINNAKFDLTGNGGNDFAGWGAAIMSSGNAKVTVNNAQIKTVGAVRLALYIGGKSTMTVNDSTIETFNGTLPADYEFSIAPGKMMEVPYGMGLTGNVRSTNLIDEATVYYNNSKFKSHGWGVLSSDGNGPTRMFVSQCVIETEGSGYGAYANGDAHDYFSNTTFNVNDIGLIIGGNGWGTFTDGTVVNSQKLGVMMHQGTGGSVLTVEKKAKINSKNTAIQIKGRGADVIVDDAELNPGNGVLIQTMPTDDPIMLAMSGGGANSFGGGGMGGGAGGPPPAGGPGGPPGGGMGAAPAGDMGGGAPPGSGMGVGVFSPDVNATLRNATLNGDVVHAMTSLGDMTVTLQKTTITGAISTGKAAPGSGAAPTKATFKTVGEVTNTLGASTDKGALKVYLDWASKWIVNKTSYMNALVIAEGATLAAPTGSRISMTVDGVATPIKAGSYKGKIVLQVSRGA